MAGSNSLCSLASHLDVDNLKEKESQLSIDKQNNSQDDGLHCFESQKQVPEPTTLFYKQGSVDNKLSQTSSSKAASNLSEFVKEETKQVNCESVNGYNHHKRLDVGNIPNGVSKELINLCDGKNETCVNVVTHSMLNCVINENESGDTQFGDKSNTCNCLTFKQEGTDCICKSNSTPESPCQSNVSTVENLDVSVVADDHDCSDVIQIVSSSSRDVIDSIRYVVYESEKQMPDIMRLITKDLSEPYSIYTYRYFIHNWPKLCFLAMDGNECVGAIVCKLDVHKKMVRRGYIAMLAVDSRYRRRQIGSTLVTKAIEAMIRDDCDEVVLETEITNQGALHLYQNLGFVRDKRLFRYYLNGVDALRLKLWLR